MNDTEQKIKYIIYLAKNNPDEFFHIYSYFIVGMILLVTFSIVQYIFNKDSINKDSSDAKLFENNISHMEPSLRHLDSDKSLENKLDLSTLQIQWEPLESGGIFFKTYKLVKVSSQRMELHPTLIWQMIYAMFFFLGLFSTIVTIAKYNPHNNDLLNIILGFVFMIMSIGLLYFQTTFIIFDKNKQIVWKKKKYSKDTSIKKSVPIDDIIALQLLEKKVSSARFGSFDSFELNFILKSSDRIYVTDYANYNHLKETTKKLSDFLNVPILEK